MKMRPQETTSQLPKWSGRAANLILVLYLLGLCGLMASGLFGWVGRAIFGLLVVLLLTTYRWELDRRLNLSLLLISITASLYIAEAGLIVYRRIYPTDLGLMRQKIAAQQGISYDTRNSAQLVQEMRAEGLDTYTAIAPVILNISPRYSIEESGFVPLAGVANALTVYCNESGSWKIYQSDEYGFNNPIGSHRKGEVEIALLGDSFIHGACVPNDQEVSAYLRESGYKVLNLGQAGNDPLLEFATLTEYVAPLEPPIVIWNYFEGNDLSGLAEQASVPFFANYFDSEFSQNLRDRQPEIDATLRTFFAEELAFRQQTSGGQSRASRFISLTRTIELVRLVTGTNHSYHCPDADIERLAQLIDEANRVVTSWGGELYFAYLPSWGRYADQPFLSPCMVEARERVLQIPETLAIPIIDLAPVMDAHKDPLSLFPFRLHGHYTGEGYALLADTIAAMIQLER